MGVKAVLAPNYQPKKIGSLYWSPAKGDEKKFVSALALKIYNGRCLILTLKEVQDMVDDITMVLFTHHVRHIDAINMDPRGVGQSSITLMSSAWACCYKMGNKPVV